MGGDEGEGGGGEGEHTLHTVTTPTRSGGKREVTHTQPGGLGL